MFSQTNISTVSRADLRGLLGEMAGSVSAFPSANDGVLSGNWKQLDSLLLMDCQPMIYTGAHVMNPIFTLFCPVSVQE